MSFADAIVALNAGEVIAYPTEGVWGLGCDPFNEAAVKKIVELKQRPANKSMILLVQDWRQAKELIDPDAIINWDSIAETWPGPVTWIFPASKNVPDFLLAVDRTIALRMPSYDFLQELLQSYGKPLVSTSANLSGQPAAKTEDDIRARFPSVVVCAGDCQGREKPSSIFHASTGEQLR